ncbi:MAG: PD-(D/E)XK nuclease family protein [Bacteroidales bacterium]|jgi:hypothetical protein|nr:PD-(D/E)XK nuclease family protein [Bacteroidales bacterium]
MNIFAVLSQGKGRLNEENLSAMLGFLLSPSQTHGLGDIFLRQFLNIVAEECGDKSRFDNVLNTGKLLKADVLLESAYSLNNNKRRIIDIEIKIYSDSYSPNDAEALELHRIAIENKIRLQASEPEQLKEEFTAILQDIEGDDTVQVTMIFLTPLGNNKNMNDEYENLIELTSEKHKKAWLRWYDENGNNHIASLLKRLLKSDSEAEIQPITEYLRHTLKAFIIHITENIINSQANKRNTGNPGEITESVLVKLSNGQYRIELYESSTVRIYNLDSQEYEVTKPILRKINEEKELGISLQTPNGKDLKNTRTLGKQVIKELINQGKNLERN